MKYEINWAAFPQQAVYDADALNALMAILTGAQLTIDQGQYDRLSGRLKQYWMPVVEEKTDGRRKD